MIGEEDIDQGLLRHADLQNRKVLRVIASFLEEIGQPFDIVLLHDDGPISRDPLIARCVARIRHLGETGLIAIDGDPTRPGRSEIRLIDRSASQS